MNNALAELYGSDNLIRLADKDSGFDHSVWDRAVKWLHSKRGYEIDDKPVRDLINETYRVLSEGVNGAITEEVPAELTQSLLNNTYIFSGFKTYHEMRQASALLRSSTGGFKSFEKFYRDVKKIDNTYNRSYLAAEYEFAVQSTQMAVKWKDWEEDGDRYLLQYRTAGDERVREEHAALNNTTLPIDDKFWDSYLPPLGWRCRCTVVQVRKGKHPVSDSDAACSVGEHATSLPKQKIFRFNPGKTGKVFPPKHPYLPKGCGACEENLKLEWGRNNPNCKICRGVFKQLTDLARNKAREELKNNSLPATKIFNDNIYTGKLYCGSRDRKNLLAHCIAPDEVFIAKNIDKYLSKLKEGKKEELKIKENIDKKIDRGVQYYTVYEFEVELYERGNKTTKTIELKCEAIKVNKKRIEEHPYVLKIK